MYKQEPSQNVRALWGTKTTGGSVSNSYYTYATGTNTISYDDGKKLSGHWPWKSCTHQQVDLCYPFAATFTGEWERKWGQFVVSVHDSYKPNLEKVKLPSRPFDPEAFTGILDQLDLNKGESVLLYSGVLQAVPLVGSVMKGTSLLNRAAKKLSKEFRRKPFTTVVKTLISLDFIDRFVISPTLDDMHKFQDATDYVLRTISTAKERSAVPFALQTSVNTVLSNTSQSVVLNSAHSMPPCVAVSRKIQDATSKAFALVSAKYDVGALSPIKLWARRVGLTRPLDSVWDLVPFSFVVDYFTRAGDFISHLSDEMSDVEGLKGTCVQIHDLWYTHKLSGRHEVEGKRLQCTWAEWDYDVRVNAKRSQYQFVAGTAYLKNELFVRQRIEDPWRYLLGFQEKLSDYLTVSCDLSSTRKRTLAELVIQAKL